MTAFAFAGVLTRATWRGRNAPSSLRCARRRGGDFGNSVSKLWAVPRVRSDRVRRVRDAAAGARAAGRAGVRHASGPEALRDLRALRRVRLRAVSEGRAGR